MKLVKWVSISVGVLILVLGAGAAYLVSTFDAARVKAELVQLVLEKTGRTLSIDGEVSLSVFPSVMVKTGAVRVSERAKPETEFASLKNVHVAVRLMPLFSQRVEVEQIELTGLHLTLVRHADGTLNIDDLSASKGKEADAEKSETAPASMPRFDVAGIVVSDGALSYLDTFKNSKTTLTDLSLTTGRLANQASGAVDASAKLSLAEGSVLIKASADYRLDLDNGEATLAGVKTAVGGAIAGVRQLAIQLDLGEFGLNPAGVTAKALVLKAQGEQGEMSFMVDLSAPTAAADVAAKRLVLPQYRFDLDVSAPALPQKSLRLSAEGKANIGATGAEGDATVKVDDTTVKAKWSLDAYAPLKVGFDLALDRLDADRYMPLAQAGGTGPVSPGKADTSGDAPIDLSALRGPEVRGQIRVGEFKVKGIRVSDFRSELWLHKGRLDLQEISAGLYGGRLEGRASADSHGNRIAMVQSLTDVNINPLLVDAIGKDMIEGRGQVMLDVTSAGATVGAMKKGLAGTASAQLKDGAIKGINLAKSLREFKAKFSKREDASQQASATEKTDFSALSASFRIAGGIARNDDLDGRSPLFRLAGAGDIDIGKSAIDYLAKATVVNTSTGQDGKDLEQLRGVTVPVRLTGPFDALSYRIEFAAMAGDVVKAKVKGKVEEKLKDKLGDRLGGGLKGLFGR